MMTGPALDGQTRRLRLPDGVHFTKAGARKLAHYVERDLIRLFDLGRGRGLQLPQEAPPEVAPPPAGRPVAGPVLPLTQPAGPVGQLAGAGPRAASPADPVAARVLTEGLPPTPVAGRADDFRWPPAAAAAALLGLSSGPGGVPAEAQDSPLATAPAGQGNAAPANAAAPSVPNIMQPPVAPAGRPAPARAANQNPPAQKATQGQPAVPRPPAAVPTVPEANRAR
jgi:hypothetical protein